MQTDTIQFKLHNYDKGLSTVVIGTQRSPVQQLTTRAQQRPFTTAFDWSTLETTVSTYTCLPTSRVRLCHYEFPLLATLQFLSCRSVWYHFSTNSHLLYTAQVDTFQSVTFLYTALVQTEQQCMSLWDDFCIIFIFRLIHFLRRISTTVSEKLQYTIRKPSHAFRQADPSKMLTTWTSRLDARPPTITTTKDTRTYLTLRKGECWKELYKRRLHSQRDPRSSPHNNIETIPAKSMISTQHFKVDNFVLLRTSAWRHTARAVC